MSKLVNSEPQKQIKFWICPYTRREVNVVVDEKDDEILCPICKINHRRPSSHMYSMKELKDLNMFSRSW